MIPRSTNSNIKIPTTTEEPTQINLNTKLIQGETLTFQINLTKIFGTEIDFTQFEIVGLELIETTITEINQLGCIDVDILPKNELEGE